MSYQLLETLFDIAGKHATNEQLKEIAKKTELALMETSISIQTAGNLIVEANGVDSMGGHLVNNLGDHAQDLLTLKTHIDNTLEEMDKVNHE